MSHPTLNVVLCWHLHQPYYYNLLKQTYQLPWTYLHGIKDYVDMVAHLEENPAAKAVINFAPILLEQLDDYAKTIQAFLQENTPLIDPLLATLAGQIQPKDTEARLQLIEQCLRANRERLIQRFAPYQQLVDIAEWVREHPPAVDYLNAQFYQDLIIWYHLAWLGETVRRQNPLVQALIAKERNYSVADSRDLLTIIGELLASIIPRYRALAEQGQIELSFTPYAHPIIPLLLDLNSARETLVDSALPQLSQYPDGAKRAHWHIEEGLKTLQYYFGTLPVGCWVAEGGISDETVYMLEKHNIQWVASGGVVLHNSLRQAEMVQQTMYRSYQLPNSQTQCFFRDDQLSDLIGFQFSNWHSDDAVAHLIHQLENIANTQPEARTVSIILDGENAWEYYPENGYHFLSALYRELAKHPRLNLTTFNTCLMDKAVALPHLVAGSWVYGTFSTWIGDKDKNRAWDMLGEAKMAFDQRINQIPFTQRALAEKQLAICEGSDWFWWFGDYNPSEAVRDFDQLYRTHLSNLYVYLGITPPSYLQHAFSTGTGDPAMGGTMRPAQENT
ncbi:glycoside hydrolase family 57 protein [Beggiatoa leptomitoformis]|uniref:Glycoside hydrolase n=1 Tax=Beggiatoa leptomitoformis TaxID=288004 RepID=A0A2N9YJ78_9GAMM|nr:glycoside hydrolase family 57 protein [Beggiatoa leptomitoformis]ALG67511.1 glycoside hydrolase [Beggiatoa leptomitoformis]AUI70266.1 glycoside hydrolase [Beggiatoa leptomitoformis]